jgi:hypothetical protein
MKSLSYKQLIYPIILTFMMTACASSTRTSPPDIDDIYWPYRGIDTSYSVSCGENDGLFDYDASTPLDIQEGERQHSFGVTITDLTYSSPTGGRVPATLVFPNGDGSFAGLLLQHGMGSGSHPGARKNNLPEAEIYARLGAVVLCQISKCFHQDKYPLQSPIIALLRA